MGDQLDNVRLAHARAMSRRTFFGQAGVGLGAMALGNLLGTSSAQADTGVHARQSAIDNQQSKDPLQSKPPSFAPRAKAVIYLHLSGAPPSLDMFDYKPKLAELNMQPCPDSILKGERFAFIKGVPKMLGSPHKFKQYGQSGMWASEQLPNIGSIADDITLVRSMITDQFNHSPAELFLYTGNAIAGNASMGSWITYGLGTLNQNLPGFVVLLSGGTDPTGGKSLWSSGFLPSVYQGVQCRTTGEPILYLSDPAGMSRESRRSSLDALSKLNELEAKEYGDPETLTRMAQYELAYRMQVSVPDAFDISREPESIRNLYGSKPGEASFANNCLLARRLVERGVRFVQLYDWGWDIHGTGSGDDLMTAFPRKCKDVDQSAAALVKDLKQRGLLDDTLVICGGEFGRTPMNEERGGSKFLGRDHHPHCFSLWMAGGGTKRGYVHGETDELGWRIAKDKVTIRDLQATILHVTGLNPYRHSFKSQGLDNRLIGPTDEGVIQKALLA
jgi:hypothetical protein